MITPNFLGRVANFVKTDMNANAKVTVNGSVRNAPLTIVRTDNIVNCSFVLDNTVQGTITRIVLNDSTGAELNRQDLSFNKILGTIFVGAFKFTVSEGDDI